MDDTTEVLIDIYRLFGMFERDAICCGTVTVPQCAALQLLLEQPREIGWMADRMGVSQSSMTRLVDGLERRTWIQRQRDSEDRRKVMAVLTEHGRSEASRLREASHQAVTEVMQRIPAEKHAPVLDALREIHRALTEIRAEGNELCCGSA